MHVSQSTLFKDYKRYFGISPIEERIRAQMEQTRYLMSNRGLTVSQVAFRVGIENLPYFSRLVRTRFGSSPRKLRRELHGE